MFSVILLACALMCSYAMANDILTSQGQDSILSFARESSVQSLFSRFDYQNTDQRDIKINVSDFSNLLDSSKISQTSVADFALGQGRYFYKVYITVGPEILSSQVHHEFVSKVKSINSNIIPQYIIDTSQNLIQQDSRMNTAGMNLGIGVIGKDSLLKLCGIDINLWLLEITMSFHISPKVSVQEVMDKKDYKHVSGIFADITGAIGKWFTINRKVFGFAVALSFNNQWPICYYLLVKQEWIQTACSGLSGMGTWHKVIDNSGLNPNLGFRLLLPSPIASGIIAWTLYPIGLINGLSTSADLIARKTLNSDKQSELHVSRNRLLSARFTVSLKIVIH